MSPRMRRLLAALLALPALAAAADVPVAGKRLLLASGRGGRTALASLRDTAIAPAVSDPTVAGAALVVSGGAAAGHCRAEVRLDAANWRPIGSRSAPRGFRYRSPDAAAPIRRVVLRSGAIAVRAGRGWPCDLAAGQQRVPVSVVLRAGTTRYCAAFDAPVVNRTGRFLARDAAAPTACPKTDVTVASLNMLHGLPDGCQPDRCRVRERIDLLFQWIAAAGCPDVVTLQEVAEPAVPMIDAHLADTCPFPYQRSWVKTLAGFDDEMIIHRHPALAPIQIQTLLLNFRNVAYVRLDHPVGPLDVFSTHLAAGSDGAQSPCGASCPAECVAAGVTTVRDCQAVQLRTFVAGVHDVPTPAIITGDFNEPPGTFAYQQVTSVPGWIDSYLAAGSPECEPSTGIGCTAGRVDDALDQLESPASNESERIDYVFVVPPAAGSLCQATFDGAADADGDGTATRIFADTPNPFAPTCGPTPAAICWPSDHEGAELDLACG